MNLDFGLLCSLNHTDCRGNTDGKLAHGIQGKVKDDTHECPCKKDTFLRGKESFLVERHKKEYKYWVVYQKVRAMSSIY